MSASRGGSGRGGTEPGVAPRRPEAVEQVADARPVTEGADGRDPAGDDAAGADGDEHEEPEERDRGRRAHAVGHRVDRDARRVTDGPEPGVGLQVLGEERAEPGGARDLQLAQLGVVHPPELLRAAARRLQGAHVQEVGVPAADGGPRPARMPGEQVAERLDEPDHEPERHQPEQAPQRVRREQHPHARAGERELVGPVAERTLVGRLPVRRTRVGRHQDARTREPGAPAEVEVLGTGERRGVEAPELLEQVGAHQHRGGGDVEDVAHAVVLLLVELAGFDAGVRRPEAVDGPADLEQDLVVVGAHQLGPEDARVRAVGLLDHESHRVGIEHHVVVAEEEEGGALHRVQRLVGGRGEAGALVETADERAREHGRDPRRGVLL